MKYELDAKGKVLGRFATEIAILLRGKNRPTFMPHMDPGDTVEVSNIDKLKITGDKAAQKIYWRHTGYPGGIKGVPYEKLIAEKTTGEALKRAVYGMLPKNKLRSKMIKRLIFSTNNQ